ncbi:MAG TPA: zf-HC2 domain-containing protein [Chthonomonadaceae bacterium]|nr:zf-HC2 domain-containing protein [Chthonomonadaceae bacterium]
MKSCGEQQANIKAYIDGELPLWERTAVWWHLLRCPRCREARNTMTEIGRRLAADDAPALDPALRARILSSVTYTDAGAARRMSAAPRRPGFPLLLLGGATAAVVVVFVLMKGPAAVTPMSQLKHAGSPAASGAAVPASQTRSAVGHAVSAPGPPVSPAAAGGTSSVSPQFQADTLAKDEKASSRAAMPEAQAKMVHEPAKAPAAVTLQQLKSIDSAAGRQSVSERAGAGAPARRAAGSADTGKVVVGDMEQRPARPGADSAQQSASAYAPKPGQLLNATVPVARHALNKAAAGGGRRQQPAGRKQAQRTRPKHSASNAAAMPQVK